MTHFHIALLFTNSNNYVTLLLAVGDYGAICANPLLHDIECSARGLSVRTDGGPSQLLRNLSDLRSSPAGNTIEGGEKVVEGEDDDETTTRTSMTSATCGPTVKESEDKHDCSKTMLLSLISRDVYSQMSLKEQYSSTF